MTEIPTRRWARRSGQRSAAHRAARALAALQEGRYSVPDGRTLPAFWFALDPTPEPW